MGTLPQSYESSLRFTVLANISGFVAKSYAKWRCQHLYRTWLTFALNGGAIENPPSCVLFIFYAVFVTPIHTSVPHTYVVKISDPGCLRSGHH